MSHRSHHELNVKRIKDDESEDSEEEKEFWNPSKGSSVKASSVKGGTSKENISSKTPSPKSLSKATTGYIAVNDLNQPLVQGLEERSTIEEKNKQRGKSFAWSRGAQIISKQKDYITTSKQVSHIPGIGKSISSFIDEFDHEGERKKLAKRRKKQLIINDFTLVHGVKKDKAERLYEAGYRKLEDLAKDKKNLLYESSRISAKYAKEMSQRIPRDTIIDIRQDIADEFNNRIDMWGITGSFRRGAETSGDIDLIVRSDVLTAEDIANYLKKYIVAKITGADKKYYVVVLFSDGVHHQMDISVFKTEEWSYGLMHSTGSDDFNQIVRTRAIKLGYTVNEYRMENKETKEHLPASKERDIFDHLGVEYVAPKDRGNTLSLKEKE